MENRIEVNGVWYVREDAINDSRRRMVSMKQTAVEWLHEKMIVGKFTGKDTIDFLFETAKEMEKEQMIEFAKYTSLINTEKTDIKK